MHRVLATLDICIALEVHLDTGPISAAGVSMGTLQWLPPWSKKGNSIEMGMLHVAPMGTGHDTGPTRPHVLVSIPPNPWWSVAASVKGTLTSSLKPMFTAHRTQIGNGSPASKLPICAEPIPYCIGLVVANACGSPVNLPDPVGPPLVPTQLTVFTGMTWGDIVGGICNVLIDMIVSLVLNVVGTVLGELTGNALGSQVLSALPTLLSTIAKLVSTATGVPFSLDTTADNLGSVVQQGIDRDGVGSDANPQVRILGFGIQFSPDPNNPPSPSDAPLAPVNPLAPDSPAPLNPTTTPWGIKGVTPFDP